MQNVVLVVHLLLALALIGVVLLQRSEGGGLGMGGGGGPQATRPPLTGMAKLTWVFAGCFIVTSITLTVLAASNVSGRSVMDRLGTPGPSAPAPSGLPDIDSLLPPPATDSPLLPPRAD